MILFLFFRENRTRFVREKEGYFSKSNSERRIYNNVVIGFGPKVGMYWERQFICKYLSPVSGVNVAVQWVLSHNIASPPAWGRRCNLYVQIRWSTLALTASPPLWWKLWCIMLLLLTLIIYIYIYQFEFSLVTSFQPCFSGWSCQHVLHIHPKLKHC